MIATTHAEHDAERHRADRHDDGVGDALEDHLGGQELADISPFDLTVDEGATDRRQYDENRRRGEPSLL